MFKELEKLIESSHKITIIIANNPDADAVGSALALEYILSKLNKQTQVYCRVNIPYYLRFLDGWDKINSQFVADYDLAIMVDNSSEALLISDDNPDLISLVKSKPLVILDHHSGKATIDFATLIINQPTSVATGEVVYNVAKKLNWPLDEISGFFITASILSDSLGLTSHTLINNSKPVRIIAEFVDLGVNLHSLFLKRLRYQHIPARIV